jgi:hypothetical protein
MIGISIANSLGLNKLSGINPDAQAFISAAGITGTTEVNAVNALVNGLQSDGLWSKMKAVYPFVTDNRNLTSYTEDFSNAYWQKQNCTITTDAITAPNGTTTADKMSESTTANTFRQTRALPTISTPTATTYTFSAYLKAGERNWAYLNIEGGTIGVGANFDLTTGTVGIIASGTTATISNVGNGWYRCTVSGNVGTGSIYPVTYIMGGNNVFTYVGIVGNGIYAWGAQLELGSTATTYQPIATTQQSYIASQFKYNLKDPRDLDAAFRLVFNGGWTHSSTGATPNGTNGYANTYLVPSSVLAQNSVSMGIYSRTNSAVSNTDYGAYDTKGFWQRTRRSNDTGGGYANTTLDQYTANTSSLGLYSLSRISSANFSFYKNGVGTLFTSASTGIASIGVFIGAGNLNGAAVEYNNRQYAFQYMSDGLTDTEAANLYTRVQAFQTSLSRNI